MLDQLCAPALLYIAFSLTQIIIDIFKNLYNTAFLKFIVMILFTIVLNILCDRGLGIISWFIVFIPFIMMTIITSLLLFVFGLSPSTGSLKYNVTDYPSQRELSHHNSSGYIGQNIVQSLPSHQSYPTAQPYPQTKPTTAINEKEKGKGKGNKVEAFTQHTFMGTDHQLVTPPIQIIPVKNMPKNT
uniref:Transmembrane protein n=1 Tax=viral metagenome TaxID=1070528 RepID=A0A6C0HGI0_9ZZZZ